MNFYALGRSGLRVSRLALGAMTFGTESGWGCDRETSRILFDRYLETGGNFIDTADVYSNGTSEAWLGEFIKERGVRDRVVLATKFTHNFANTGADPNAAGNGRKNIMRALEASLKRLKTDYIDLYFLHTWDRLTPVEEVLRTLDDLVRQGKIRHAGLSDSPAWYASRAQTMAELRGWEAPCALQLEYSLVARGIEYEFPPMCQDRGMGVMVWSPLASGLLSGKYRPHTAAAEQPTDGRLKASARVQAPPLQKMTERNWAIVAELERVATELDRPMAQVAVNWVANRPAVASVILGATSLAQLNDTLPALDFELPAELEARLDRVSALPAAFPYAFIDVMTGRMHGDAVVESKPSRYLDLAQSRRGGWG
jgi:aryl-alcohol dehydrogenase-like predicted oxidoreductase